MKNIFTRPAEEKVIEALYLIIAIIIWQLVADRVVQNKFILPSFSDVIIAFFDTVTSGLIFSDTLTSLLHFSIGFGAALTIGIPLGIAMGWFKQASRAIDPLIKMLRLISPFAWIIFAIFLVPWAIVFFGLTHKAIGFVVFVGMVFPILINTYLGLKKVSAVYVETAEVSGYTKNIDLKHLIGTPSALHSIVGGIRIASGMGWMCLLVAEYLMWGVSTNGFGYQIWHNYYLHRADYVIAYILLLGFVSFLFDQFFRYYVDAKILRWTSGTIV
ncbi:MAG: ABC transporter permease [Alphaproteobacteria bacterium]|nr:MAG: ABC transporter permease [Alphaproteobacteria bacterium]